jgi:hypothetical protein
MRGHAARVFGCLENGERFGRHLRISAAFTLRDDELGARLMAQPAERDP